MQVKTGFDTSILNPYILPFLYECGIMLTVYRKYGKSFFEIIQLPASCAMRIP